MMIYVAIVRNVLEIKGTMGIITVNNGVDVIRTGRSYEPDLVIVDVLILGMPGNNIEKRFKIYVQRINNYSLKLDNSLLNN